MSAADSATHWNDLANEADARDEWNRAHVGPPAEFQSAQNAQANTYRQTAWALALEADTGIPHCHACFGPHPAHRHSV